MDHLTFLGRSGKTFSASPDRLKGQGYDSRKREKSQTTLQLQQALW